MIFFTFELVPLFLEDVHHCMIVVVFVIVVNDEKMALNLMTDIVTILLELTIFKEVLRFGIY